MTTPITVPALGESVSEATVAKWMKNVGDAVKKDEALVELETDKVTVEVFASVAGTLGEIIAPAGTTVAVGTLIGNITAGGAAAAPAAKATAAAAAPAPSVAQAAPAKDDGLAPAVRKLIEENGLNPAIIAASGKDGRLTKGDVL